LTKSYLTLYYHSKNILQNIRLKIINLDKASVEKNLFVEHGNIASDTCIALKNHAAKYISNPTTQLSLFPHTSKYCVPTHVCGLPNRCHALLVKETCKNTWLMSLKSAIIYAQ
jgi:hypothetical protein